MPFSLRFESTREEQDFVTREFRRAYKLHLTMLVIFLVIFTLRLMTVDWRLSLALPMIICLLIAMAARMWLHRIPDRVLARQYGVNGSCFVISIFWFFYTSRVDVDLDCRQRRDCSQLLPVISTLGLLLVQLISYLVTISIPGRLMLTMVGLLASANATPNGQMTVAQHWIMCVLALSTGFVIAYSIERMERLSFGDRRWRLKAAATARAADSRLNHLLKNKVVQVRFLVELADALLSQEPEERQCRLGGSATSSAAGEEAEQLHSHDKSAIRAAAPELLTRMDGLLQQMIDWTHSRELVLQACACQTLHLRPLPSSPPSLPRFFPRPSTPLCKATPAPSHRTLKCSHTTRTST